METPQRHRAQNIQREYTAEEKKQLLANLDIEVAHRTRQFEASLADILENFRNHHEGQVLRVPHLVRGISMAEFGDKYNGDINECLRGLQKERHGGEPVAIDASARKRKWQASQEGSGPTETESFRVAKSARLHMTPKKVELTNARKPRILKTPGTTRISRHPSHQTVSPSTTKSPNSIFPVSPSKAPAPRLPSTTAFNPHLPKTPAYPRPLRKNESLMSLNGSPLVIPSNLRYFANAIDEDWAKEDNTQSALEDRKDAKRISNIIIRQNPSYLSSSSHPNLGQTLPRTNSQSSLSFAPSSQTPIQSSKSHSHSHTSSSQLYQHQSSSSQLLTSPSRSQVSAVVRVTTKDGHLLEFDPLLTSPEELDSLEGISNSAKKQAKEDMTRLVQSALTKWKIV